MRYPRTVRRASTAVLVALALLATACGGDDAESEAETPTTVESEEATPTTDETGDDAATEGDGGDVAAYFEDRRIDVIVPYGPGGGYDVTARLIIPYLEDALPGNPRLRPQNVPGGGGSQGIAYAMQQDPGSFIGMIAVPNWYTPELVGSPQEGFSIEDMYLLGTPNSAVEHFTCARADRFTSWEDLRASGNTLKFGALGEAGGIERQVQLLEEAGFPVERITGYDGGNELIAAFARGEIDATTRCSEAFAVSEHPELIESPGLVPLWYTDAPPSEEYLAEIGIDVAPGDIPELTELPGFEVSEPILNAFKAAETFAKYSRTFWVHNDLPAEIKEAWEVAFTEVAQNEDFRKTLERTGQTGHYLPASDIRDAESVLDGLSEEGIQWFRTFVGTE